MRTTCLVSHMKQRMTANTPDSAPYAGQVAAGSDPASPTNRTLSQERLHLHVPGWPKIRTVEPPNLDDAMQAVLCRLPATDTSGTISCTSLRKGGDDGNHSQ